MHNDDRLTQAEAEYILELIGMIALGSRSTIRSPSEDRQSVARKVVSPFCAATKAESEKAYLSGNISAQARTLRVEGPQAKAQW